jgi:hypothetical protein
VTIFTKSVFPDPLIVPPSHILQVAAKQHVTDFNRATKLGSQSVEIVEILD